MSDHWIDSDPEKGFDRSKSGQTTGFVKPPAPSNNNTMTPELSHSLSEHTLQPFPQVFSSEEVAKTVDDSASDANCNTDVTGRSCRGNSPSVSSEPQIEAIATPPASRISTRGSRRSGLFQTISQRVIRASQDNAAAVPRWEGCNNTEEKDPNLIEWDGPDDPENPQNWPRWRKWVMTMLMGFMTFCISFASSVFSTATLVTAKEFHVSNEVMVLGTSLFVLGYAVGPPIWGPMSELFGRKYPLFIGYFIFVVFQIPVAVATNVETIMLCRFLGGTFGSAPFGIVAGALTDFWDSVDRGIAITIFSAATFLGPACGPIIGGFVVQSHLGWRWTAYLTAIMAFSFGIIGWICIPETYGPVLLSRRAARIRFKTKNWAIHAKVDEQRFDSKTIVEQYLLRSFKMLIREPILLLLTLYISLIYGCLYLFFEAYPISFQEERHWNRGVGALPFIGLTLGVFFGCGYIIWVTKTQFALKLKENGRVVPEERLPPMMIGAAIFPIGMFWFAWTSNSHITWVPQVLAGVPLGAGIIMIFLQGLNYIIDCYLMHANSAISANTLVRSFTGAGFPLFATAMYHTLGVPWATSLLGFLTLALVPVPVLFYLYGARIRRMSKYSPY